MRSSISVGLFCLALAASAASPDFRTPPLGAAGLATNLVMTWGGYTLGAGRNGYADHIWIPLDEPTTELTVCSWVAIHDADGANYVPDGGRYSPRGSSVLPNLYYSPNVERSAPDILDGAWGWGTNAVTVAGSASFDYAFPTGGVRFLEYVEMDGEQQIVLDFVFTPRDKIEADWQFTQVSTKQQRLFNQRPNPGLHVELYINGSGNHGYAYEQDKLNGWLSKATAVNTARFKYGVDGPNKKMYRGTTTWNIANLSSMTDADCGIVPMSIGRYNSGDDRLAPRAKCYGVQVWRSGVLERDLRPAVDLAGPGLLDVLHGRIFRSSTSSNLLSGPVREPENDERCYSLGWNGGATGTNAWPRGVYTVAWTNLSSTMTLTAGGTDMTLEAPAGVRNIEPGEASGFILTGSGAAQVGISRMKVHPFYATGRANDESGATDAEISRRLVGTNWCFVAHRVRLDSSSHTNALTIMQRDGRAYRTGVECEFPPDGTRSLLPSGWYQQLYSCIGTMRATYVYEWDRRVFDRWLDDDDLAAIFEDGCRIRAAFGYPDCVVTNAIYQEDP